MIPFRVVAGRRIPYVQQTSAMDCGPACLAMVLGFHGRHVKLESLRRNIGRGRSGTSVRDLLNGARKLGLDGYGAKVEDDEVNLLEPGAILHWRRVHFVVFERLRGDRVDIIDPNGGRRSLPLAEFNRDFSHLALILSPTVEFVPSDDRTKSPTWTWMVQVTKGSSWLRIVITSALIQLLGLAIPLITGGVVDRVLPRGDYHLLLVLMAGFACVVGGQFLANFVRAHLVMYLRSKLDLGLSSGFSRRLIDLPLAYFLQRHVGDLMARYGAANEIRNFLTQGALNSILDGALALLYFAVLFWLSPAMAFTTLLVGGMLGVLFLVTKKPLRDLQRRDLEAASRAHEALNEMISAMHDLKAMGADEPALDAWMVRRLDLAKVMVAKGTFEAWSGGVKQVLMTASPLILLGIGAVQVMNGHVTLGTMLSVWSLATAVLTPLGTLMGTASEFQGVMSACERVDDVFEHPLEQSPNSPRRELEIQGAIELRGVSFRYAPDLPLVLKELDLRVEPGQMVAIVGRSGSGKSTLANVLLGLFQPESGGILFDGMDLRELDLRGLRRQLGIVIQEPYIFSGTIRENVLKTAPEATEAEIRQWLRLACLEEEVAALASGLDTMLPEGGSTLSGGQRQRLAILRALARKPKILLLDEATSALDAVTEHHVHKNLAQLSCTRIVIAHRLSTIIHSDVILVMDRGRVVEKGKHQELVALGGAYAELVRMQLTQESTESKRKREPTLGP